MKFAVLRIEIYLSPEGRVDTDFGCVKVVDDNDEAVDITARRRERDRIAGNTGRTYIVRSVEE